MAAETETRRQQAEIASRRLAEEERELKEAKARCIAEEDQARRQEKEMKVRHLAEQERMHVLSIPIDADVLRDMREFLKTSEFFGEEQSPLAYVGYRVGKTKGLPVWDRYRRLKACFQIDIPKELADKYQTWGKPVSRRRFDAISQHLTMLADMRRVRPNFEKAVADWQADERWFTSEYSELVIKLRNTTY